MPRVLTPTAAAAILARETGEVFLPCLRIVAGATTYRLVANTEPVTRADGVYQPYAFDAPPPEDSESVNSSLTIRLDNVDRSVVDLVREFDGVPECTIDWIIASEPNSPVMGPFYFSILACDYDEMLISLTLGYEEDFLNQAVPSQSYNPVNSSGLFV